MPAGVRSKTGLGHKLTGINMDSLTAAKRHIKTLTPAQRSYATSQLLEMCCMEIELLRYWKNSVLSITAEQANDEGLWLPTLRITEGCLQAELRRLHATIEGEELLAARISETSEREQLRVALQEADTIMGHDDSESEWRGKWAHLWPNV